MANKQVVEVPVYEEAMLAAIAELNEATGATAKDTAEIEALFADRFDRNAALYVKEGAVIDRMYGIMLTATGKEWNESQLFDVCKERYGMTMEKARFNRCHRLFVGMGSLTVKQTQAKLKEYRVTEASDGRKPKIETLVPFITGATPRSAPKPEAVVASYNKRMEGSVLDWTTMNDAQLDAHIAQAQKEKSFRKWCADNADTAEAKAHIAAIKAGTKRRGAAVLAV